MWALLDSTFSKACQYKSVKKWVHLHRSDFPSSGWFLIIRAIFHHQGNFPSSGWFDLWSGENGVGSVAKMEPYERSVLPNNPLECLKKKEKHWITNMWRRWQGRLDILVRSVIWWVTTCGLFSLVANQLTTTCATLMVTLTGMTSSGGTANMRALPTKGKGNGPGKL